MLTRIFTLIAFVAVACLVLFAGTLSWREDRLVQKIDRGEIKLSDHIELPFVDRPGRRLARRWLATGEGSAEDAERHIRQSIENRPLYAPSWLDLAEIKIKQGDTDSAIKYIDTANRLWPNRGKLRWRAAMIRILLGQNEEAVADLKHYLLSYPGHLNKVVVTASRLEPDVKKLLASIIPDTTPKGIEDGYYQKRLIGVAANNGNLALANAAWGNLLKSPGRSQWEEKLPKQWVLQSYISALIKGKQKDQVERVWAAINNSQAAVTVHNGGFEEELLNYGLGWINTEVDGVKVEIDTAENFEKNNSLKVEFDGTQNLNFYHLRQYIPVESGKKYRLTGHWRGADISTRTTPYIEFFTVNGKKNTHSKTESKRRTWHWSKFELELNIPEDVSFAIVRLRRLESKALDKLISGTIWLDDLKLVKVTEES